MQILLLISLFIFGACFGSFLCCEARRLHLKTEEKPRKGKQSKKSIPKKSASKKPQKSSSSLGSRSVCLHCRYQLKWYDNIPILSWLFLKGKCRKCGKKIGLAEFLSELLTAIAWLALGLAFLYNHNALFLNLLNNLLENFADIPLLDWLIFLTTLLLTLPLIFLSIYDGLYGELPTALLYLSIIISLVIIILKSISLLTKQEFCANIILDPLAAATILSGIYLVLYLISHGKWVGDGDWLLALTLALALGSPWLALITLFLSNALATIVSLPTLKRNKTHSVHFGPYLVIAFIIVTIFSVQLSAILS